MVSLADLRARNVTPIWQEAVAVVQELIQTVKATTGSAELLPDLEHVALIPNGDVVALPGSPEPAIPVRHAAVMLKLLIDGVPVPPELEQFVARNVAESPQYDTVAEFSRNLAFFERPGRRSDVERLVGRALAAEQTQPRRGRVAAAEGSRVRGHAGHGSSGVPPAAEEGQDGPDRVGGGHRRRRSLARICGCGSRRVVTRRPPPPAVAASCSGSPPRHPSRKAPQPRRLLRRVRRCRRDATSGDSRRHRRAATAPGAAPAPRGATAGAQGDRSLLDRAGDAVRSAVNTLVGSTPRRRRRP